MTLLSMLIKLFHCFITYFYLIIYKKKIEKLHVHQHKEDSQKNGKHRFLSFNIPGKKSRSLQKNAFLVNWKI